MDFVLTHIDAILVGLSIVAGVLVVARILTRFTATKADDVVVEGASFVVDALKDAAEKAKAKKDESRTTLPADRK